MREKRFRVKEIKQGNDFSLTKKIAIIIAGAAAISIVNYFMNDKPDIYKPQTPIEQPAHSDYIEFTKQYSNR